ncbi:MAG: hypothetical protein JNN12_08965, partial [Bacteroidetes Order II. Incertae sedis bacterium]|nr:hypothetical protein [Bacteroidetes Order II. bacterium]
MQKLFLLLVALLMSQSTFAQTCASVANATQEMIWTGTVSTDWNDACNWSPNGAPTADNPVLIPDVTNDPIVPTGITAMAKNILFRDGNPMLTVQSNATLTVTGTVVNLVSVTITNSGTISTSGFRSENNAPPVQTLTFLNQSTGVAHGSFFTSGGFGGSFGAIRLTNHGTINYSGSDRAIYLSHYTSTFDNYGTINITGGTGIQITVNNAVNHACGKILISAGAFLHDRDEDFLNHGLVQVAGDLNISNNERFVNYGVVKYGRLTRGEIKNTEGIIVHDALPIFTYGSSSMDVVNGIFTDADATLSAGTFTAPNTFTPSGTLPTGSQTLYAKITPSGGTCSFVVPFTYNNTTCTPVATATQEMIWTGTFSTDWNDACNWSPNGVPTATNRVTIYNVTNDPVILSGTTANAFQMDIGISANLTINNGGTLNMLPTDLSYGDRAINIYSNATFTNNGTLNATTTLFMNMIVLNDNTTFNNGGTANLGSTRMSIVIGGENAMVNNSASGIINFQSGRGFQCLFGTTDNVITNQGTMNYTGFDYFTSLNPGFTLNNSGTIDIQSGSGIAIQGGTLSNQACAKILMPARLYDNRSSGVTTNAGLMITGRINNTNGSFTNNGVLKYNSVSGNAIINNQNSSVIVNDTQPIFTYGGTYDGTIYGIFTDPAATMSAGTFTAPNIFVPSGLPFGSQTLFTRITPQSGTCSYVVPFSYNVPYPPVFSSLDTAAGEDCKPLSHTIRASDLDGDVISYRIVSGPSWLTLK